MGSKNRAMGAQRFPQVERIDQFVRGKVNHGDVAAVGAGRAHAGIAVDGNEGAPAVGRSRHFVAGNAAFIHRGNFLSLHRIDNTQRVITFICNQQQPARRRGTVWRGRAQGYDQECPCGKQQTKSPALHKSLRNCRCVGAP